jgi:hypothetical protein
VKKEATDTRKKKEKYTGRVVRIEAQINGNICRAGEVKKKEQQPQYKKKEIYTGRVARKGNTN